MTCIYYSGRKGPFTRAIFAAIFVAIPNRSYKLAAISWKFRRDLSPQNRRDFEHARMFGRFPGDFFSLRITKTYFGVPPRIVCHKHGGHFSFSSFSFSKRGTHVARALQMLQSLNADNCCSVRGLLRDL